MPPGGAPGGMGSACSEELELVPEGWDEPDPGLFSFPVEDELD